MEKASYILSAYSFIEKYSLDKLLDVGYHSKNGNPIPSFDENLLIELCSEVEQIFAKENNTLEINGDIIIVGDIHGSLHDLLRILKYIQNKNSKVLFLGDYVDRGNFSIECITLLFAIKIIYPEDFFLIRGNHEFDSICSQYGFKSEILNYHNPKKCIIHEQIKKTTELRKSSSKNFFSEPKGFEQEVEYDAFYPFNTDTNCYRYTEKLYTAFINVFAYLPIAAILNKATFCIHGGLSPKLDHIDDINRNIKRPIDKIEDNPLLSDVMWSDPSYSLYCMFDENPRGRGYLFNIESVSKFLKASSLTRLIRAHQCVTQGVLQNFGDKCITVFSASSYNQPMGNSSTILHLFQQDDTIIAHTFDPLIRLEKKDAFYYKVQSLSSNTSHLFFSLIHPKLFSNASNRSIIINKPRQIRSHCSANNISAIHPPNARLLYFVKPKFTTNLRRSLHSVPIKDSFQISASSHSESEDIPYDSDAIF